jgi:hypothetical protein
MQVTMERAAWVDVHPVASLEGSGPVEFNIVGTQDEYLDLNDTALYVKVKVVKNDGTVMEATMKPYPTDLTLAALFSDVCLTLNDTVVEGGHYLYPYKAMMSCLLQFDGGMKKTQLEAAGYNPDTNERTAWFVGSKSKEFVGPLYLDVFSQSKYLLPGVNVRVKLTRSKNDFVLINSGSKTIKLVLEQAILYVRKVKVAPSVLVAHEHGLTTVGNAIYPLQQTEMLSYTVAQGTKNHMQDNLLRGQLPKLLIVGLVSNDAFNGNMKKDPLLFDHNNLNYVALYRDGESVPYTQPLQPDFDNGLVARSYLSMIQSLEMFNTNLSNGITLKDFTSGGRTLFVFNLTPDLSASGSCGQPYQTANLRLELKFSKSLAEAINVVILAIRDGRLEITKQRQVLKCA